MGLNRSRCPEAAYGLHGMPNTNGRCPYCSEQLVARGWNVPRPHDVPPRNRGELLERRADVDAWGRVYIPADTDPEIDPDPDDEYFN